MAEYLRCYGQVLEAARELVTALEHESFGRLGFSQARRREAVDRIQAMGPLPWDVAQALREAVSPIIEEIRSLDARAAILLDQHRGRLTAQSVLLDVISSRLLAGKDRYRLPDETVRYLDLAG